jgi:SDR family mycofactocin-dependent oxidoreductase
MGLTDAATASRAVGRVDGRVALITGAARGQGRSHAVRLAEEGADIIAFDLCGPIATARHSMASRADLDETVAAVSARGRRIVAAVVDVRDLDGLRRATENAVAELGRLDIVVANAGIFSFAPAIELSEQAWQDVIDVNLTGVWKTCVAAVPSMLAAGNGGSVVIISSAAGLTAFRDSAHYVSAKFGVVGLMKSLALELGEHGIRVNSVNPTTVDTKMVIDDATIRHFLPDQEEPDFEDFKALMREPHILPVPWVEPVDVSNAVVFLASDESRFVTGVALPVDAGLLTK